MLSSAAIFLGLVLYVPPVQALFRFSRLHPSDLLLCLVAGTFRIAWFEVMKMLGRRDKVIHRGKRLWLALEVRDRSMTGENYSSTMNFAF
jgi:cation transport ATPase-like protein